MDDRHTLLAEHNLTFIDLFTNKTLLNFYKQIEPHVDFIYYTDQNTFSKDKHALFFSFEIHLNQQTGHERRLLEITHFVTLFSDCLAQIKYKPELVKEFERNRISFERNKMEDTIRKEVEEKEKEEFIKQWKEKDKLKKQQRNQFGKKIKSKKDEK
jgi:hypothetical protein